MCVWDRSGVRWCGAGSAVVGMICVGATLEADAGVCVAAAGRRRAEGALCTGARQTLRDGVWGWLDRWNGRRRQRTGGRVKYCGELVDGA